MLAGPSPEALIGPIAAATTRIRVGSGGVMLPHYSPFKVAETFSVLSGLFPGRIDLGVGRAAGTDPITAFALQRDRRQVAPDDFAEQLAGAAGRTGRRAARGAPARPAGRDAARAPGEPRGVAAGLLAAERGVGRAAGPALRVRGLHQPRRQRLHGDRTGSASSRRAARGAAGGRRRLRSICAETDGEARRAGVEHPDGDALRRPRAADRVPPVERALLFITSGAGIPRGGGSSRERRRSSAPSSRPSPAPTEPTRPSS